MPISRLHAAFAVLLLAAPAVAQTPRLEISADTALVDEPFRITVSGLSAVQAITIRADGIGGVWRSSANFTADASGRVDIADATRFIWSATGNRQAGRPNFATVQDWIFTAETGGRAIASDTLWRRAVSANVRVVSVRERGLVGMAYYPADSARHPAIIIVPGSSGGLPGPGSFVGGLASRGYVVLALAFFNVPGLPQLHNNIPLEYFATATEWLKSQPEVDSTRVGFFGTSRGGELALLLGSTYPSLFRVIVANVPSSVVWPGLSDDSETPAWTLNGKPLFAVPAHFGVADRQLRGRDRFLERMRDKKAVDRATIAVERIAAPLLLFGSRDDQIWPSDVFVERVVQRLKAKHFAHPVEHYLYEDAGHTIMRPYVPTSDVRAVTIHPVTKRPNMPGGTPEGQARANEDAWRRLLTFLDKYLKG